MPEEINYKKDTKWFRIVGVIIVLIVIVVISSGNGEEEETQPEIFQSVSISQEIKDFIEISNRGPTTVEVCEAYGGREIFPKNYEELGSANNERMFIVKEKEIGQIYKCVYFGEGRGLLVTMKSCCWKK